MQKISSINPVDLYDKQRCEIHKVTILYFKTNKLMNETQCWDCIHEANKKKKSP